MKPVLFSISLSLLFVVFTACNNPIDNNNDITSKSKEKYLISFYNVENLFDTIDDPIKFDEDFLPESKKEWNSKKYNEKLQKLSIVLSSYDSTNLPDVFGLCEIENIKVIQDLIQTGDLREKNYEIVHFETTDKRGIDNALVYNADFIEILNSKYLRLNSIMGDEIFSRDIVYVKAKLGSDTIHFMVNHWPSRRGGKEASEPKREAFAKLLKSSIDSILNTNNNANIIIMGDFNDEPTDNSIYNVLQAKPLKKDLTNESLYNLAFKKHKDSIGTYHYWKDNVWNMLDQFIVSGNLLNSKSGLTVEEKEMHINDKTEFLYKNNDGEMVPSKSYGKYYYGGYSDHLSVYIYLVRN